MSDYMRPKEIKAYLAMVDLVHKWFPKEYLELVESDLREQHYRVKIKKLYQQALVKEQQQANGLDIGVARLDFSMG